jgi:hypothetical protein
MRGPEIFSMSLLKSRITVLLQLSAMLDSLLISHHPPYEKSRKTSPTIEGPTNLKTNAFLQLQTLPNVVKVMPQGPSYKVAQIVHFLV